MESRKETYDGGRFGGHLDWVLLVTWVVLGRGIGSDGFSNRG